MSTRCKPLHRLRSNRFFSSTSMKHARPVSNVYTPPATLSRNSSRRHTGLYVFGLSVIGVVGALTSYGRPIKIQQLSTQSLANTPKIEHNVSLSNIQAACRDFEAIIGAESISTERADLVTHSGSDYQSYAWTEDTAVCSHVILYPESTEQVSELMKVCFRRRLPVTPYSGGTSIEGQYIPHFQGICIDFGRMNRIVELNKFDLDCVVQPGIGWMDLNEELASHGLFFPPDPGPGAMIGGMVGTGCSGTNAAAYGTMKDWVLSLTVVLADGTIIKTRQRARKSSAGYDLTRTFIGSEGTLGLVTEATLKLAVKPPCEAVAVCTFPTLRDAASAVREVLSQGIQVAAVEILDEVQMRSINESALTRLKWKEEPTLFFKFTGSDEFIVQHLAKQVGHVTKRNHSTAYTFASDENERDELWSARKNALWSMLAMRKSPTDKVWTTDVAVPLSRLPDIIEFAKDDIEKSGLLGSVVGHVGDGNFHTLLLFPEDKRHVAEDIVHRMVDKAIEMNGTATGEHGVGLVKRDYLEKELGKGAVDTMRAMKNAFDPKCLLNCDKVIRMQAA
ncbi:probable D-lactate dehydrogenase (cytochrome) [Fusarium torulosum]|uniref:D-lactate dehydrogenase (cytochrome) n=1 Tax=Fusarium torulosum TaxID=33205 RepID=A0AAE8SCA0_9HYPO|nr:probable D-lactate dehydrogenase (cytochrome) [Fusarium torulosum]